MRSRGPCRIEFVQGIHKDHSRCGVITHTCFPSGVRNQKEGERMVVVSNGSPGEAVLQECL